MDAAALAHRCADAMQAQGATSRELELRVISADPSEAVLAVAVSSGMANWHDICHGRFIYLLANTVFGFAANSRNQHMVAQHCNIAYLNPARRDDELTARAIERQRAGRSGIYDVTVTRPGGTAIAEFRGQVRAIDATLVQGAS